MKQTDFAERLTQALDLRVCCFCSSVPWAKEKALRLRGRPEGKKKKAPQTIAVVYRGSCLKVRAEALTNPFT